jgi:hypothetical protein
MVARDVRQGYIPLNDSLDLYTWTYKSKVLAAMTEPATQFL